MHCTLAWAYLFNKFWPTKTTVKVLGYDLPEFELPNNFEYISLGKQRGPSYWSNDMIDYFSACLDDYFFLTTEDGFIIKEVNERILDYVTNIMTDNLDSNLLRICLTKDVSKRPHSVLEDHGDFQIIQAGDNTQYRNSLQHSIWHRQNFLKELPTQCSPWQFETDTGKHNDMTILATNSNYALHVGHGYKRGRKIHDWHRDANDRSIGLVSEEVEKIERNNWIPEL
jgi:hypothetical protein